MGLPWIINFILLVVVPLLCSAREIRHHRKHCQLNQDLHIEVHGLALTTNEIFKYYCNKTRSLFTSPEDVLDLNDVIEECTSYAEIQLEEIHLPTIEYSHMRRGQRAHALMDSTRRLLGTVSKRSTEKLYRVCRASELMDTEHGPCVLSCNRHNAEQVALCGIADLLDRVIQPVLRTLKQECQIADSESDFNFELPDHVTWSEVERGILAMLRHSAKTFTEVGHVLGRDRM